MKPELIFAILLHMPNFMSSSNRYVLVSIFGPITGVEREGIIIERYRK
jgi:hypothetical protein